MIEPNPRARRSTPLRAAPIRSNQMGPAARVDITVSVGEHRPPPWAFLLPRGGSSAWSLRYYGLILLALVVMGLRILNLSTYWGDEDSHLSGFLAGCAVAVGTVALILGLVKNGVRRQRKGARRGVAGSLWASPVGDAATRRHGEVIAQGAGGRGSLVLSPSGVSFVASPGLGISGAMTWTEILAVELTLNDRSHRGRTDQRIVVRDVDDQELSIRARVDDGALLALSNLGARVPGASPG